MRPVTVRLPRVTFVVAAAALLVGCDAITGSKKPKVELTPSSTSATIGQGANTAITLSIKRTKFDKTLTISVEGTPAGVSAVVSPSSVENGIQSANLLVTASASAVPGKSTLTIRAKGEGIADDVVPIDVTVTPTGAFTVGSIETSVSAAQGGGASTGIRIVRTGGNGANVDLAASGLPSGMTASFVTAPTTTSIATMIVSVSGSVAAGTYPVTITATSPGFPNQTTTVSVVVVGAPPTATLNLAFCVTDFPIWVAYKNEGYNWQQAQPTGTSFSFAATDRLGVIMVFQNGGSSVANIYFSTRGEFTAFTDRDCDGNKTLSGSVAGLGIGQQAKITMGVTITRARSNGPFTLSSVNPRPLDLVASKGDTTPDGFFTPDRIIVRHNQDLATGATIPALDFTSSEAVAPAVTTLSLTGTNAADAIEVQNTFWSRTSTFNNVHSASITASGTSLKSVPASLMIAGDLHELFVDSFQESSTQITGRSYVQYTAAPVDQTAALGPSQNVPSMSVVTTAPYSRIRGVVASQPEYDTSVRFGYFQGQSNAGRSVNVSVSAAYLGGRPATWDVTIPDFTGTPAFNANWMPASGQFTSFYVEAFSGRTDLVLGALPSAGDVVRLAYYVAALNITTLLRGDHAAHRLARPQYFRR